MMFSIRNAEEGTDVDITAEQTQAIVARLHRVQGQLAGVARMIEEGQECRDVARQLSAASKALERASAQYLVANLTACLRDEEAAAAEGYTADEIQKLFLQLA
jgi:DNA-binding FrmR family transcriptional regulator